MIDERTNTLAKIQAALFEYSCSVGECASSHFIKQFLFSEISSRMIKPDFVHSSDSISSLYSELEKEKKLTIGKEKYPEAVMYWIGYLLSVMSITRHISPKQAYRIIKPNELLIAYEAYHSLEVTDAVDRILESKGFDVKNNFELFKSIREHK